MTNKNLTIGLVVVAIVAIIGIFTPAGKQFLGAVTGTTNYNTLNASGLGIGTACNDSFGTCNGTALTGLVAVACNLIDANQAITASTTKAYDCAVTNLTSSFKVIAQLSTTTIPQVGGGSYVPQWLITSAKASTTAGFATIYLTNLTGVTQTPSLSGIGSSTVIWAFK